MTVLSNNADDTLTWKSRRLHLCRCYFMNARSKGKVLTDDWLSNQAGDWTSQPHKASELLRDAEPEQEGRSISGCRPRSEGRPGLGQGWIYPSSTVQAICAPAIDILRLNRSSVERRRCFPFISALEVSDGRRDELL